MTETKNVSVLFYKNVKIKLFYMTHTFDSKVFFTFLVALAHGAAAEEPCGYNGLSSQYEKIHYKWAGRIGVVRTAVYSLSVRSS